MAPRRLTVLLFALLALIAFLPAPRGSRPAVTRPSLMLLTPHTLPNHSTAAPAPDVRIVKRSSCAECVEGERCVAAVDGMVSCIYEADTGLERRTPV
ncbi:hypothetical protein DFJ74DRAFT_710981 [Hyaloraphidium curvatum]|nr:hypothetical protein DFJ74DRAFT_710981 [Hyaloraphidium curvatum]